MRCMFVLNSTLNHPTSVKMQAYCTVTYTGFIHLYANEKTSYHPRHALARWQLLVHVELIGHIVGHACLILELWAQPCSRHPLASRLAVRTTIGARIGHHIHLESSARGGIGKWRGKMFRESYR